LRLGFSDWGRSYLDGDKLVAMLEDLELGLLPVRAFQIQRSFFDQFKA
jgi:restriction system protein